MPDRLLACPELLRSEVAFPGQPPPAKSGPGSGPRLWPADQRIRWVGSDSPAHTELSTTDLALRTSVRRACTKARHRSIGCPRKECRHGPAMPALNSEERCWDVG